SDGSVRSAASASEARSAHGCFLVFDDERVDAVLVVDLAAGHRRVEHAGHAQFLFGDHGVLLMTVEQVHDTVVEGIFLAGDLVGQRSLALHAVHGFDVVLVMERRGGPGVDHGVVEREADALLAQHHAAAAPGLGLHIAVGVVEVIAVDYVHSWSFRWSSGGGVRPCNGPAPLMRHRPGQGGYQARTASAAGANLSTPASMMSSPACRSRESIVSAGMILMTSSSGPEVSRSRPLSNA